MMRQYLGYRRGSKGFAPASGWPLGLLLAGAAAWGGCTPTAGPEALQLVVNSRAAYDRGDDQAAVRDASTFLQSYPKSNGSDAAYYLRGLARYRQGDVVAAREDLRIAAERTSRKDIRAGALKALGEMAFAADDMDAAEDYYSRALIDAEPGRNPADEIRYRLGCVLQRKGRWAEADEQFDRVVHVFGGSEIAKRAEHRLRSRAWTVQAGRYGRRNLADAETARLRGLRLPAATHTAPPGESLGFTVDVGRYATYEQAVQALPAVQAHRKDAFVTPTR